MMVVLIMINSSFQLDPPERNSEDIFYNCKAEFNDDGTLKATYAMNTDWECKLKNEEGEY